MEQERKPNDFFEKVRSLTKNTTQAVSDVASGIAENTRTAVASTVEKVNMARNEKKASAEKAQKEKFTTAMLPLNGTEAETFIYALGDSPITLTARKINQIKDTFPVPREQVILWADAEFDLRPSGIVVTNKGVFIRTNVSILDGKIGIGNFALNDLDGDEQQAYLQHQAQYHSGKSVLLFYSWDDFDANWFAGESEIENKALLVEPQCSKTFVEVCRNQTAQAAYNGTVSLDLSEVDSNLNEETIKTSVAAGAAVESSQIAIFAEQKSNINTPAGHGEMAEEAITILDKLHGLDAKVVGRDNAKDGADRQIGDIFIQTKYYNSACGSLEACFNPETGQYRYMSEGKPMQLEVPKDQYENVVKDFRRKIENGKVPGVTDPNEAAKIVRKGRLTYQQAVNLTKPGTIESLSYDALTGVVTCSCALGITFVATVFFGLEKNRRYNASHSSGSFRWIAGIWHFLYSAHDRFTGCSNRIS